MTILKSIALGAGLGLTALPALPAAAGQITVPGGSSVATSVEALSAAVEGAGARVFLAVDFAAGARSVDMALRPTTVVVFGSPKIGAAALADGQTMALTLPLRILAWEDEAGAIWLTWEDPAGLAPAHGIAPDHPAVEAMGKALSRFAAAAAKG